MTDLPVYAPPGLSVRATFYATDGTRPQELIVEWATDPGQAVLDMIIDKMSEIAGGSVVRFETARSGTRARQWEETVRARRTDDPINPPYRPSTEAEDDAALRDGIERHPFAPTDHGLSQVMCRAEGPAHLVRDGHWCCLPPGHEPVEPEGRAHQCGCGGLFATDAEVPDVPGRQERDRRHREGR